ncbi:MAG: DNA methylase [Firmicutes bacterium]|nr:DNA methylase [Bacillota bacterium]
MEPKEKQRTYIAIDLKSFFASVECSERGLNPMTTNLVVADASRTTKTICLAVTPSLKSYGVSGRARLFEVVQRVKEVNAIRANKAPGRKLTGESFDDTALKADPSLAVSYLIAPPRMAKYMEYSTRIYEIYLKYVAPEDMHIYSIDEVFMDVTDYLAAYKMTAHELAMTIIRDVLAETNITATVGIGTNMYLAKIAMDIVAKRMPADEDGVRIAELDEMSYRKLLWSHRPLTDFWRVGRGYARKLEKHGLYTMGDIARCSLGGPKDFYNEDLLYKLFGINAELLIDHAWGWEPVTIKDIKGYKPESKSICSGQVLQDPYDAKMARLVVHEMTDMVALDLVSKGIVTDQIVLTVGYDIENLTNPEIRRKYKGEITIDPYGRKIPKHAHGTANLPMQTSASTIMCEAVMELYDRIVNPDLLIRRINLSINHLAREGDVKKPQETQQLDLFSMMQPKTAEDEAKEKSLEKEKQLQQAMLGIKEKFGKNALVKGMNLEEGATAMQRNKQIGGHKA